MSDDQPKSLGSYKVPPEREKSIITHIASLSETARAVSDQLAFGADAGDVGGLLETRADEWPTTGAK